MANVVARAWRRPSTASPLARFAATRAGRRLRALDLTLIADAAELAAEHGISLYDAAYAAAAAAEGWRLVSGDERDRVRPGLAIAPRTALDEQR